MRNLEVGPATMRISKRRRSWLAVAATTWALGRARADYVVFNSSQAIWDGMDSPGHAIFLYSEFYSHTFPYTVSGVTIDEILLCTNDTGTPRQVGSVMVSPQGISGANPAQITTTTPTTTSTSYNSHLPPPTGVSGSGGGLGTGSPRRIARGTDDLQLSTRPYPNGGGVFLDGNIVSYQELASAVSVGMPLFFQAKGSYGQSYSRLFTLVKTAQDVAVVLGNTSISYSNPSPYKPEQPAGTQSGSPAASTQTPNATTGGSGDQSDGDLGNSGGSGAPNHSSSSSGLSTGAIAGIAVACGVVGLLVAAAVWYLLRRRQQHRALLAVGGAGAYGGGKNRRADTLMAEKEAGADVDVSPHSPYSDDGASGGGGPGPEPGPSGSSYHHPDGSTYGGEAAVAAGAAGTALHHHSQQYHQQQHLQDQHAPRSYTPYSDDRGGGTLAGTPSIRAASLVQQQTTDEAPVRVVSVPSATPGRATPRALTTPYAHLVEEGMTEDEIRRLEEEERQLDAAIEQAGRR